MKNWKLKAIASLGMAATLLMPVVSHAICGDVDKNGSVNIADAVALAAKIAASDDCGASKPDCNIRKDNFVDITDLVNLVAQLAGIKTLFDPCTGPGPSVACGDGTDAETGLPVHNVEGDITSNQTWPNTCTIHITGETFVKTNTGSSTTVLTIQPGTIVRGQAGGTADPAVLIILPGARIDAQGTATSPIIMTSGEPIGQRHIGDWGGLVINGRSTVNRPNCTNSAEGIPAPYGGCDADDSSGIVTYTRVEFSGIEFTPNNELNIVTLNGVGRGTQIDHIQGNAGGDDCIEWFGGTVNVKYFVSSGCADDGFDWQLGTTGARQYGLQVQYGPFLQTGAQSRGIEADNSEFGSDDLPRSNPTFCNLTMIGARDQDVNFGSQAGLFFRRGTAGHVANSIVTEYRNACIRLDDAQTSPFACDNSSTLHTASPFLLVDHTLCFDNGTATGFNTANVQSAGAGGSQCTGAQWYALLNTQAVTPAEGSIGTNPNLGPGWGTHAHRWDDVLASGDVGMGGYPTTVPNLKPTSTSGFPAATNCHAIDDFMDNTTYIGAFDPNGSNWLDTPVAPGSTPIQFRRWISFDVN